MTAAERLLARLDGVRETKPGRWKARCPAHPDRNPSLCIDQVDDGRLLVKCQAGCATDSVMFSVGLSLRDLFERPIDHSFAPVRQDWHLREAIAAIAHESRVVTVAASDIAAGLRLSDADVSRLAVAAGRIAAAHRRLYGA